MNLAKDLLEQAEHLSKREKKKPKQASLRRSASTAYYALFHLLSESLSQRLLPNGTDQSRARLQRLLGHKEMKHVCARFLQTPVTNPLLGLLAQQPSDDLKTVALAFVQLQEARHAADYDLTTDWTRSKSVALVTLASNAFQAWKQVDPVEAEVFLLALYQFKHLESTPWL